MEKKEKKKIIIILTIILIMIVGISYAWLRTVVLGEKDVQITVGNIDLVLDESASEGIKMVNTIPTYDKNGKEGDPYIFSLENKSNIALYYTLSLTDDNEALSNCTTTSGDACKLLNPNDIRYELKMGGRTVTGTLSDSPIINYGVIGSKAKIENCELRVWLNIDATGEAMGKVYLGKLKVFATQQLSEDKFEQGGDSANAPEMDNNMIAVKHNGYNWVKTDESNGWYNYGMGIWANAVTVKSDKLAEYKNASIGTEIAMDDIETMWVWIPRYSYTIAGDGTSYYGKKGVYLDKQPTKALPGEIDVKFVDINTKDRGTAKYLKTDEPSNWYTPDGFTFGNEELSGIWVGKFETSSSNPNASYGGGNTTSLEAIIKPNVPSWRGINVSNIHTVSTKVSASGNRYGFSSTMNSHAMKNDEWSIVSYLSQSRYGKLGNANYKGAEKEVYQNKSDSYITGCSYGSPSNGNEDYGCQYKYDNNIRTEEGIVGKGVGASTTGTVYGVYDMSGGAWEYVLSNYNDIVGSSGFTSMPEAKYYNKYTSNSILEACNGKECTSHGLSETAGWYSDGSYMVREDSPWMLRGGYYHYVSGAGVFGFGLNGGNLSTYSSFRLVMSPSP